MGQRDGGFPPVKQAFGIALAATVLLAGVLLWLSNSNTDVDKRPVRPRSGGGDLFDPRSAAGRDIFVPEIATASLDGEELSWPGVLFWCGSLEPGEDMRISIERLRVLVNPKPRTRADLARLVTVPDDVAPTAIGAELDRLIRAEHSGLVADHAVFLGGHTLQTVRQMELHGNAFVARRLAGALERELIRGSDLSLDFDKGELLRARSSAATSLEGPIFSLTAEGLNLDARNGALVLSRKVVGTAAQPLLDPQATAPFTFRSEGALKFTPNAAPNESAWFRSGGLLECGGGIEAQEASASLRAERMDLRFSGAPLALESLDLHGTVDAQLPLFHARGDRLQIAAHSESVSAEGAPLALRWTDLSGALRILETEGRIDVGPADATGARTLSAPGSTQLGGPDLSFRGRQTTVLLRSDSADSSLAAGTSASGLQPQRIHSKSPVGRQGPCEFSAAELLFERGSNGTPDMLRLEGEPRVLLRIPAGAQNTALWLSNTDNSSLVVVIEASERIELVADPLRIGATRISAQGRVRLRVHAREEQGAVLARLLSEKLELTVQWLHTPALSTPSRFSSRLELQRIALNGDVAVERGLLEAHGDALLLDLQARTASLQGNPALVRMKSAAGVTQHCSAPAFRGELLGRLLCCDAPWNGSLFLPLLTREPTTRHVPTTVSAGNARLHFGATGDFALESMEAAGAVSLQQEQGGAATCTALQWLVEPARLAAQGSVHLALSREHGPAETITAPTVEWFSNGLQATGPVEALLAFPTVRLLPSPVAAQPVLASPSPTELLQLHADGALTFHEGVLLLQGPLSATQGDPAAAGMSLSADKAALFFDTTSGGTLLERLVLDGKVLYASRECSVKGELLRLDQADRRLLISGGATGCNLSLPRSGLREHVRPSFVVDFHDPQNPVIESVDRTLPSEVR